MNNRKGLLLAIGVILMGVLITAGSYAFWSWQSSPNKSVVFNTSKALKNYIVYDEGESKFVGDFKVGSNYQDNSIHSTISLYKTNDAANFNLMATIHMDVNSIGENMKKSNALKWVVTEGNSTNPGQVLAQGNFVGTNSGDTLTLVPNIEVTTTRKYYTVWIWLDKNANPSDSLSGETLDTNVWTEINQLAGVEDRFEITRINANYQNINATVVDSKYKVTSYAVVKSGTTPSTWTTIDEPNNIYNLSTNVTAADTYDVYFKDENGRTTHKSVTVTSVDNTPPSCTFGNFTVTPIKNNETSDIVLTCTDSESEITVNNLTTSDITRSNSNITITNIKKSTTANGYKYTITVRGTTNDGTTTLTLPAAKIKNAMALGNTAVTSNAITVKNITDLSDATVTLNPTSYTYDGTEKRPTVTVVKDGVTLRLDTDYTVTYTNNKNAGTNATVTITGKNDYEGTTSKKFTINKREVTVTAENKTMEYGTSAPTYTYKVTNNVSGETAVSGTATYTIKNSGGTTVTVNATTPVGTYTITPSGLTAGSNYTIKYANGTLTINKVDAICPTSFSDYNKAYDGENHTITATGESGGTIQYRTATSGDGSTWTTTKPTRKNAGTTTVYVQIVGDGNHNTKDCGSRQIKIAKYDTSITLSATSGSVAYNSTATFKAKANTIAACLGTLTAVSADTGKVSITGGASEALTSSTINTDRTITYKGLAYTTGTNINVNYAVSDTANCNSASQKQFSASVSRIAQTVSLSAKTGMKYTGSAQAANTATTSGNGSITYLYYTNNTCTTQTGTAANAGGASAAGGAPKTAGTWYAIATAAQTNQYNAASSGCVKYTMNKYTPTLAISATSGSVNYNATANFTGTPTTISSCQGTLTATSASATYVTVANASSGTYGTSASHSNVANNTAKTFYYKGVAVNSSATNITLSYTPSDTSNCDSATTKTIAITVNKVPATNPTLSDVSAVYNGSAHAIGVSGGSGGTIYYRTSTDNSTWESWSTTKPSLTNVGKLYVQAYVKGDGNHTDTSATASKSITINNAKLTFNKGTCDTPASNTILYTKKGATGVYTGIQNTTAGTIPSASKTGYTFNGWYTASSGGSKVLNANGSFTGTAVTNYTTTNSWNVTADQTLYAQCTVGTFEISLDNQSETIAGTTAGTTVIYETYGSEYYLTSSGNAMTTSANPITKPTNSNYVFGGYYTAIDGGTQYISSTGYLTSSASNTYFTADGNLYASWYNATAEFGSYKITTTITSTDATSTKTYAFAISTSDICDDSLSFLPSENNSNVYNFTVLPSTPTTYYTCVRVTVNGETLYVKSNPKSVDPKPIQIFYNTNQGTISGTTEYFTNSSYWVVTDNNASSINYATQTCYYGSTCNLWNYNSGWLIERSGYELHSGEEWKARQGDVGSYTYLSPISQSTNYSYTDMIGFSQRNLDDYYEVNLYANWVAEDTLPIRVYYNANGTDVTSSSTANYFIGKNQWIVSNNSSTSTNYVYETVNSGGTLNLYDHYNTFKLSKPGHAAKTGEEWMTKDGSVTFNEAVSNTYKTYKAAATKKTSYYELDLYVNWVATNMPYCTKASDCEITGSESSWRIGVKSSTTVTIRNAATVDYFLVGGGGGGGGIKCNDAGICAGGGGGGGGNVVINTSGTSFAAGSYTVTVGSGGPAGDGVGSTGTRGGTSSIKNSSGTTLASAAGGYGGKASTSATGGHGAGGATGGSGNTTGTGGRGAYWVGSGTSGGHSTVGGDGVLFSGDSKYTTYKYGAGGGGGGAGTDGTGACVGGVTGSSGGTNGGGRGACVNDNNATAGSANSGSGGGGNSVWRAAGTGGTGYVVIKTH